MEMTLHMGCEGETNTINIDWFDHNNIRKNTVLEIKMAPEDKPRTLIISVNDCELTKIISK